jgi:hypothetical protein
MEGGFMPGSKEFMYDITTIAGLMAVLQLPRIHAVIRLIDGDNGSDYPMTGTRGNDPR